jgi:hypothetical protein
MMDMTALGIKARSPQYLSAKVEATEARRALRSAENRAEFLVGENERHAAEVAKAERWGYPTLITNAKAHVWSGSAASVIYRTRCTADGHDCDHDAREQPYSDAELHAATAEILRAERKLKAAERALADLEASSSFDVAEACREAGSRYAWWPDEAFPDPSKRRYQGQPIADAELETLGPLELQRQIAAGAIVEIPV